MRRFNYYTYVLTAFAMNIYSVQAIENNAAFRLNEKLAQLVTEQKEKAEVIGLGAMIMQKGKVIASGVSGLREKGSGVLLSVNDKWHIGSITKSFTATMLARLVEKGSLNWDTKIKDVFMTDKSIHQKWLDVSIKQLLTHTSGVITNFPESVDDIKPAKGLARMSARNLAVLEILNQPPEFEPGSKFQYSNVGLTIAGVIAEKITNTPWETLIRREVFAPLNIKNGGFGHPQDINKKLEQPRGHRDNFLGFTMISQPDDGLSPIYGPAGTIHMTMNDLLIYANDHLVGEQGSGILLGKSTYKQLHQPLKQNYALGWVIDNKKSWANGPVFWHNGSNGKWFALLVIIPNFDTIIVVTSNHGRVLEAQQSAWEIIKQSTLFLQENEQ